MSFSKSFKIKKTNKSSAKKKFKFKSKVIVWKEGYQDKDDSGLWRFARVPEGISAKIKEMQKGKLRRGWGAVYARVKIGKSEWLTSVFPDWHSDTYILPLKNKFVMKKIFTMGKISIFLLKSGFKKGV